MKTLSRNTIVLLIGNISGTALAFLISLMIGRTLGDIDLGVYSVVLAWIFSLSMLVDAGFNTLLTRDLAQYPEATTGYLKIAVPQRLIMGGAIMFMLILAAPLLSDSPDVILGLRVSAPLLIIEPLYGLYTAVFRARQVMQPIAWLNVGMLIVQLSAIAIVFTLGYGIQSALLMNTLTSFGRLVAAYWVYQRYFRIEQSKVSQSIAFSYLMKLAFPFAVAAILAAAQQRLSILQLEWFATLQQVGYYTVALRFIDAGRIVPNALFGALYPSLADLSKNPQEMNRLFARVIVGIIAFGIVVGAVGNVLAEPVILLTYGDGFLNAIPVLKIGLWMLLPSILRGALTLYFYTKEKVTQVNILIVIMLIVQLLLGYWLIPRYGAIGMILVILIVEWLATIIMTALIFLNHHNQRTQQ